jgi:hypothetical protein
MGYKMPQKLPDQVRQAIIEKWLLGHPRSGIVIQCQVSAGAVSSVVDEWRNSVGLDMANLLRDLAVTLRKLGMSPAQCTSSLRIMNLIDKMGMDANSIEIYLSEVYGRLRKLDINPMYISRYVEGLVSLVDSLHPDDRAQDNMVSTLEIDLILQKKRQSNALLDDEHSRRKAMLDDINQKIYQSEKKMSDLNQRNKILEQEIGWKSELRDELEKYGLDVSSVRRVVDGARFFSDKNYSINEMLLTYSDYRKLLSVVADQKLTLNDLTDKSMRIKAESKAEEDLLQERRIKNAELDSLKKLGFGLRELKILHNLIIELATENGLSTENRDAVQKFISDIENHAYDYRHLRKAVENLKNFQAFSTAFTSRQPRLSRAVDAFLRKKGITYEDVNRLIELIELFSSEDMSSADSEALEKENESRVNAKVGPAITEARQAITHQDVEKSEKTQQANTCKPVFTEVAYKTSKEYLAANPAAIDSPHEQLPREIYPLIYSDGDQYKDEKIQTSQVDRREEPKLNRLTDPVGQGGAAQDAKVSRLPDGRSNVNYTQYEYDADSAKLKRSSKKVTDGKFTMNDDSLIVTTNTPPADEMHRKLVKPRFPRPLTPRKSLHREHYETRKLGNGKVRDGHVTPAVEPNSNVNEVIRQRTDFTVDFEHSESSSPEGADSLKPKKGQPASNPDITELMRRAMCPPHTR